MPYIKKFLVVEIDAPNLNSRYILIPNDWAILKAESEKIIVIAYPKEEECRILERIRLGEPFNPEWPRYMNVKKHYESGKQPVSSDSLKVRILLPKSSSETERRSLKPRFISRKLTEQRDSSTPEMEAPDNSGTARQRSKIRELFGTESESSTPPPTPTLGNPTPHDADNDCMSENEDGQSRNDVDDDNSMTDDQPTYEDTVAKANDLLAQLEQGLNSGLTACDKLVLQKVMSEQNQISNNLKNITLILRQLCMKQIENKSLMKDIVMKYSPNADIKKKIEGDDDAVEKTSQATKEDTETADDDNEDSEFEPDESKNYENSGHEEVDSKWTLKHPNPRKGLIELPGESGIYIDAQTFAKSHVEAHNVNKLAWLLFQGVFKKEALETCTLIGRDRNNGNRKPLHAGARKAVISYARRYGKNVGWEEIPVASVEKSMRNAMYKIKNY
ncbi:hypothetical protein HF086_012360 [Spodoptera exigua]|uniref:BEN domain-containing protein n=1 Tax=Spodoptera exigua TaxID=7107 RepID=A0A922SD78_SPOEX|nr:hypothetical protein HF086_012360 [Spodoptera exigua]